MHPDERNDPPDLRRGDVKRPASAVLGRWIGFLVGALAGVLAVILCRRYLPPDGDLGELRTALEHQPWGEIFGGFVGAVNGALLGSAIDRWLGRRQPR
jgi:hypothetical protein